MLAEFRLSREINSIQFNFPASPEAIMSLNVVISLDFHKHEFVYKESPRS